MSEHGIYWGDELLKDTSTNKAVLIERLLWDKDVVMLVGDAKVGKSIFALQMACALTSGATLLDIYDVPAAHDVLYVQLEGTREDTQARLRSMLRGVECDPKRFTHLFFPGMALDTPGGFKIFSDILDKHERTPKVIIIDPLYMAMNGDIKDSTPSKAFIENMQHTKEKYGAAIIIIHHTHRERRDREGNVIHEGDRGYFGSYVWKAFPDHMLVLSVRKKDKLYTLTCDTQRSAKVIDKIDFKLIEDPLLYTCEDTQDTSSTIRVHQFLKDNSSKGWTLAELMKELSISKAHMHRVKRHLLASGLIRIDETVRPFLHYSAK